MKVIEYFDTDKEYFLSENDIIHIQDIIDSCSNLKENNTDMTFELHVGDLKNPHYNC